MVALSEASAPRSAGFMRDHLRPLLSRRVMGDAPRRSRGADFALFQRADGALAWLRSLKEQLLLRAWWWPSLDHRPTSAGHIPDRRNGIHHMRRLARRKALSGSHSSAACTQAHVQPRKSPSPCGRPSRDTPRRSWVRECAGADVTTVKDMSAPRRLSRLLREPSGAWSACTCSGSKHRNLRIFPAG